MFKRTFAAIILLVATLMVSVSADAADARNKDDTWLVYLYVCGADNLEGNSYLATKDIAEMQQVKLPPNVKVLVAAGSTKKWHHPTIAAQGHGIYLYSANRFEKLVDWNTNLDEPDTNMSDPNTLASFLKFGEENFPADHKVIIFWDHGGVSGICYDDSFKGDGLMYDELKSAFATVYGDSPEKLPFELIGFKACVTGSYELANSIANFSHYMLGSEPSVWDWNFSDWIAALAKDPSMDGAQIGKIICDSALKSYDPIAKRTHTFSLIDLTKMPELRAAYEAYFDEAVTRANNETGFKGAFARAAENRNVDKYSNWYVDLGLLVKNTKSIMPDTSKNLLKAIDNAVVYNKRGSYLKSKGISTYYPYVSPEETPQTPGESGANYLGFISKQNSNYYGQKELYGELLGLDVSNLQSNPLPIERNSKGHLVAKLTPEQLENVSSIQCVLLPVNASGNFELGGALLSSADDLKIDWTTGTVTENFRGVEPMFDGHRIVMYPTVSGRGHTFYNVPIIYDGSEKNLIVRYDTSNQKYEIIGFGSTIENGMVRGLYKDEYQPKPGHIINPIYWSVEDNDSTENVILRKDPETEKIRPDMWTYTDPQGGKLFIKAKIGAPLIFTRDSSITNKKINKGNYFYMFMFNAPNGDQASSYPGVIIVRNGKTSRFTTEEFAQMLSAEANN